MALIAAAKAPTRSVGGSYGATSLIISPATAAAAGLTPGALVTSVDAGGPAALGGVEVGDIVMTVNGSTVDAAHPFLAKTFNATGGQSSTVSVFRNGARVSVTLAIPSAPG